MRSVCLNNIGIAYRQLGDLRTAISWYGRVIALKPAQKDLVGAYYNRSRAYESSKQHDLAIRDFSSALELDPECIDAYFERGAIYGALGQHGLAERDLQNARKRQDSPEGKRLAH